MSDQLFENIKTKDDILKLIKIRGTVNTKNKWKDSLIDISNFLDF